VTGRIELERTGEGANRLLVPARSGQRIPEVEMKSRSSPPESAIARWWQAIAV
jgi:hypothetical protein